jgi:hypothetical protein
MNARSISNHASFCLLGSMLLMGCDEGSEPSVAESSQPLSQIGAGADCNADFCDDFSDGTDAKWNPQGGLWEVIDNEYVGTGVQDACDTGFSSNETLVRALSARNVELRVDMRSMERVDKGIVLRSSGPGEQIELNFRAAPFNDLAVQEISGCVQQVLSFDPLPHEMGQTIDVQVRLVGNILKVWMDGELVLERCYDFRASSGAVGLAVIDGGVSAFDNVQVDVLN